VREQISNQLARIDVLEKKLEGFERGTVEKKELKGLRQEYRKLWETQHLDQVNLKAHVWSIGKSLPSLSSSFERSKELMQRSTG